MIRQNLLSLALRNSFEILLQPSSRAISELERRRVYPDFIFLDPPYQLRDAYRETLELLGNSELSGRALVIAEHERKFDPGARFGTLLRTRKLEQGDAALSFYRRE